MSLPTGYAGHRSEAGEITQASIDASVAALVASAPASLNTLKELADAINDDASFATTITNALAAKATSASVGAVFTAGATAPQDVVAAFGAGGLQRQNRPTITINGAAPAAGSAVPAALGAFSGTLLTDALTALGTLFTRVDLLTGLVRKLVERDQSLGIAT